MAEDQQEAGATIPPAKRKPRLRTLLLFLAIFAALLIAFREVLFPFLMAIYIAYLVEPLVARAVRSRLLGIKWTRGPTIVIIYVVVLGGLAVLGWAGITTVATTIRDTSRDIAVSLKEGGHRADFRYAAPVAEEGIDPATPATVPPERAIIVPTGTRLQIAGIPFVTLYKVRLDEEQRSVSVLLEHERQQDHKERKFKPTDQVRLFRPDELRYADGKPDEKVSTADLARLSIAPGGNASGLEYFAEREFISPIVQNLAGVGFDVEPTLVRNFIQVQGDAFREDLPERVGKTAVTVAGKLVLSIYQFFLILMLTAFIVMDRRHIAGFFSSLPPDPYKSAYERLIGYIDDGLAGVIRGQLVICGVNGLLTYFGLLVLGVPYAVMLSCVAAILSLIPVFGTIISSVPIVLIAATDGIDTGVYALVWILFIHALEANLFNPLIMGSHASMHPVIIVFALLAGEHSFGIWGALLAVPTMSILLSCFRYYLYEIEGMQKQEDNSTGHKLGVLWTRILRRFGGAAPEAGGADAAANEEDA
jgi:predicted PurR-regulated permease PerM